MSWFNFFQTTSECTISFGRGINASLNPHEEELFNNSYEAFHKKNIIEAYEYFFQSFINFSNETSNENITLERRGETLHFEIYQGTAKIVGIITDAHLQAEVIMVKKRDISVALKRYILERNYQFTYTNYFSDAEFIKLKLYLDNITMSPQKIFFPLRELALNADFDKEHIASEFPDSPLEDIAHLQPLNEEELRIKFNFLKRSINELEEQVLTLPSNDNAGMQAFSYLNILLKIDYLLVPKYTIYQKLSKKAQEYFGDEHATIESKNEELRKYVLQLHELTFEEFSQNFYDAKYSFNPIEKSSYDELITFINESLNKIKWYKNNRYPQIIPTIYEYIAFYALYNYGVNSVVKELLHTLVIVQNSSYFAELGCELFYDAHKEEFFKRSLANRIEDIVKRGQSKYKNLFIDINEFNFNSLNEFSFSFYNLLKNLDFEEL